MRLRSLLVELVVRMWPSASSFRRRGAMRLADGDTDGAIEDFGEALRRAPESAPLLVDRSWAWSCKGDWKRGLADAEAALAIAPRFVEAHLRRAQALLGSGALERAVDASNQSLAIAVSPGGHRIRGRALAALGDYEAAWSDAEAAIALGDREPETFEVRAVARAAFARSASDHEAVVVDAAVPLAANPHCASALRVSGCSRIVLGDLETAATELTRLTHVAPDDVSGWAGLAMIAFQRGDFSGSERLFNKAVELAPERVDLYVSRGLARLRQGRGEAALDDLDRAVALSPSGQPDPIALNNRGYALATLGRYSEAAAAYAEALASDPDQPNPHKNLAWLLATCEDAAIRDGGRAVELASRALQLRTDAPAGWLQILAAAHAEAGDFDAAVAQQLQADRLAEGPVPSDRLAAYRQGRPWRSNQQNDEAAPF